MKVLEYRETVEFLLTQRIRLSMYMQGIHHTLSGRIRPRCKIESLSFVMARVVIEVHERSHCLVLTFAIFVAVRCLNSFFRYQILAPTAVAGGFMDGKKACEKLLDAMQLEKASYRVGTSKVMHTDFLHNLQKKHNTYFFVKILLDFIL